MPGGGSTYCTHFGQLNLSEDKHKNARREHERRIRELEISSRLPAFILLGLSDVHTLRHARGGQRRFKSANERTEIKALPTALPIALTILLALFFRSFLAAGFVPSLVRQPCEGAPTPSSALSLYGVKSATNDTPDDVHAPYLSNRGRCWGISAAAGE